MEPIRDYLSVCLSIYLSIYPSIIYLSIIYLSIDQSMDWSICLLFITHLLPINHLSSYNEIYYKKMVHVMMVTEKSHDVPLASWEPRKAGSVNCSWTWRPENHKRQCCKSQSKGRRTMSQLCQELNLPLLLSSIWALSGLHETLPC